MMCCRSVQSALNQADLSLCFGTERWRLKSCALHHRVAGKTNTVPALSFLLRFCDKTKMKALSWQRRIGNVRGKKLYKLILLFYQPFTPKINLFINNCK